MNPRTLVDGREVIEHPVGLFHLIFQVSEQIPYEKIVHPDRGDPVDGRLHADGIFTEPFPESSPDTGIMERVICAHDRRKAEYRLTPKGVDLLPALLALRNWGEKYGLGVASNPVLADRRDRQPVRPITVQGHDGRPLGWADLMWLDKGEVGTPAPATEHCCD